MQKERRVYDIRVLLFKTILQEMSPIGKRIQISLGNFALQCKMRTDFLPLKKRNVAVIVTKMSGFDSSTRPRSGRGGGGDPLDSSRAWKKGGKWKRAEK